MSQQRLVFMRRASGLVRELTATDVVIWSIAAPTASGLLYYQVSTANEYPGANPLLSFIIGGIILLPLVIALATLMRIMPRSGGMYVAISRLVDPSVGYVTGTVYAICQGLSAGVMAWVGTSVLSSCFSLSGHAGKIPSLVAVGEWMAATAGHTIVAIALTLIFWLVCLISLRAVKLLMRVSFVLPLLATIVLIIFGGITSDATAAFDRTWGAGVFQKVLDAAAAQGWTPPPFSWASTIGLLLVVFWAYQSFEFASAVAGEVKNPQRSLFGGIIGGYFGTMLLYVIVTWSAWHPFVKSHFIQAYVFLYDNHPEVLQSIMPLSRPSLPLFLGSLIPSPWVAVVVMLLVSLWFYNTALPGIVVGARFLFAMSFDRQLPKAFARVSRRGVPDIATHAMMVFGILAILLNVYGVQVVLGMVDITGYFPFWAFGLAAMMLPYKRPDIYMLSPMQSQFLGIPVISWLGALATGIGWFLVAFSISPLGTGPQVMFCLTIFVLSILYMWSQQRNIKEGVDLSAIYAEIPPE
ncbi:MAG TPA: amino acid permease [Firmicutes bacterium]|nr:amino acid permease [Bacillota bacterium]